MGGPLWVSFSPSASMVRETRTPTRVPTPHPRLPRPYTDEYPLWLVKFIRRSEEEVQLCVFDLYSGVCWPSSAAPFSSSPPLFTNIRPPLCRYMLIRPCLFWLVTPRLNFTSAIHRKSPLSRHRSYRPPA